jgi:hypothetical protein
MYWTRAGQVPGRAHDFPGHRPSSLICRIGAEAGGSMLNQGQQALTCYVGAAAGGTLSPALRARIGAEAHGSMRAKFQGLIGAEARGVIEPIPSPPGRPKFPPTDGTVLNATNAATGLTSLRTVYNGASDGDQIVLADGNYGAFNFNRDFDPDNPVIIRSKNATINGTTISLGAIFTGTIRLTGTGHWLHQIKTQQPNTSSSQIGITIEKNHQIVTRCWINNADGIHAVESAGLNRGYIWLGWNRFTGQNATTNSRDQIFFSMPGEDDWRSNTNGPHQIYIYSNFFWDNLASGNEDHSIYFGDTKAGVRDVPIMWEVWIEENFWHVDCNRRRILYLKRGAHVMYNQCNASGLNWGTRHGRASVWWGNRSACDYMMIPGVRSVQGGGNNTSYPTVVSGGSWPTAADGNHHDIRGNIMTSGGYRIFAGCIPSINPLVQEPPFQAGHFAVLVGNRGAYINVGHLNAKNDGTRFKVRDQEGGSVEGVKIYKAGLTIPVKNSGTGIACRDADTMTISNGAGGFAYPGDGTTRDPASYASNGSDQGFEVAGQAAAT